MFVFYIKVTYIILNSHQQLWTDNHPLPDLYQRISTACAGSWASYGSRTPHLFHHNHLRSKMLFLPSIGLTVFVHGFCGLPAPHPARQISSNLVSIWHLLEFKSALRFFSAECCVWWVSFISHLQCAFVGWTCRLDFKVLCALLFEAPHSQMVTLGLPNRHLAF